MKLVCDLVAELLLDRLAAVVVREGPAAVADRADVGEGDLQRAGRCGGRAPHGGRRLRGLFLLAAAHERAAASQLDQPARAGAVRW